MNKLKEVRFFRRVSQFRLSNEVGIAASKISLIENDLVAPKPDEKKRIADFFGMSVEEIFHESAGAPERAGEGKMAAPAQK